MFNRNFFIKILLLLFFTLSIAASKEKVQPQSKRGMTVQEVIDFKAIQSPSISGNGLWVAYAVAPDRGDGEVIIKNIEKDSNIRLPLCSGPYFSKNSQWLFATLRPKGAEFENAEKDKPKSGLTIYNLTTLESTKIENVKSHKVSNDSKWLVYQINAGDAPKGKDSKDAKNRPLGSDIVLRQLETGSELSFQNVSEFEFDSLSKYFAYTVAEPTAKKNGIYLIDLNGSFALPAKIASKENYQYSNIEWGSTNGKLAFISAKEKKDGDPDSSSIFIWNSADKSLITAVNASDAPKDWFLPFKNNVQWTKDGKRLFFGFKPLKDSSIKEDKVTFADSTYSDVNTILKKTELDLWHWNDQRIKTNQKNWWKNNKDSIYRAVYNTETQKFIQLTTEQISYAKAVENDLFTIAYDDTRHLKAVTWDNEFNDIYLVNLNTGERKLIAEKIPEDAYLSPKGNFVVYYKDLNWFLYNTKSDSTINLTARVGVAFHDEEWDQPSDPASYGFGGWMLNDDAVIIYDRYDVWRFGAFKTENYLNQTGAIGREMKIRYRIYNLDPDEVYIDPLKPYYLSGFQTKTKETGIFNFTFDILGTSTNIFEQKRHRILSKAKDAEVYLLTREAYDEFPDLWVTTDSTFKNVKRISDVNPIMKDLNFGKAELVEWLSYDKDTLQGYIIKPENFDPAKKYPILIYYYDRFSDMFYNFFQPRMNHRPCYPLYTADGYLVFMPDIVYKTGYPGRSAINCVVSGLRHLASKGYVDTSAIAIQGHSWGGYQTAYMITQTNLFTAACAGAPVGNMTSAYSGIRLESGRVRQMQYEKQQSRIGGNLWDSLNNYIDNSPVFKANNCKTPFLIMFGNEDDAVPFQQGVELYMAYRRLNKECWMLEYRNEPHIPRKYQNKLDYAIKMKEFFDHYCLKKPAPDWMLNGIEYKGN